MKNQKNVKKKIVGIIMTQKNVMYIIKNYDLEVNVYNFVLIILSSTFSL